MDAVALPEYVRSTMHHLFDSRHEGHLKTFSATTTDLLP